MHGNFGGSNFLDDFETKNGAKPMWTVESSSTSCDKINNKIRGGVLAPVKSWKILQNNLDIVDNADARVLHEPAKFHE